MHSPYRLEVAAAVQLMAEPTFTTGDVSQLLKARNDEAKKVTENLQAFEAAGLLRHTDPGSFGFWYRVPSTFWTMCAEVYTEFMGANAAVAHSDPSSMP